jgi:putative membrane protein
MKSRFLPSTIALFAGLTASGWLMAASNGTLSGMDEKFATAAAGGGMAEVKLGELALKNASNADVKKFAQRMVDDHTKAGDKLKTIASKDNINLPSDMDAKDKATYDRLSKLQGAQFDQAYMRDMVKDHKTDVAEFQKEANGGKNADLKSFASDTLPTLQEHLKMAQDTLSKLK